MQHACFQPEDSWAQCISLWRESLCLLPVARTRASRILVVPPDITRSHSGAAELMREMYALWPKSSIEVLPALGTHQPMTTTQLRLLYGALPPNARYLRHDWRDGKRKVGTIGTHDIEKLLNLPVRDSWAVHLSCALIDTHYDLIVSIGQVMPHEVVGMSNYTKNIIIGLGGVDTINLTHYWSACYGIRRIIGQPDNPIRALLQMVAERYLSHLPIVYAMTIMRHAERGAGGQHHEDVNGASGARYCPHALVVGDDMDAFYRAAAYSKQVHIISLRSAVQRAVVYLQPQTYRSLWIANKAIYRLGGVMAQGGEMIIFAHITQYAEDKVLDALISRYGYTHSPAALMREVEGNPQLLQHAAAIAHLMHSAREHFTVRFALPEHLKEFIVAVGFEYVAQDGVVAECGTFDKPNGWYRGGSAGEQYYFARDPAHYLWQLS